MNGIGALRIILRQNIFPSKYIKENCLKTCREFSSYLTVKDCSTNILKRKRAFPCQKRVIITYSPFERLNRLPNEIVNLTLRTDLQNSVKESPNIPENVISRDNLHAIKGSLYACIAGSEPSWIQAIKDSKKVGDNYTKSIISDLESKAIANICDLLPTELEKLVIDDYYNKPLLELPKTLTHLTCGKNFNEIIYLHTGLTHLTLGNAFNRNIDNCLPDTLIRLVLGDSFNQQIDHLPVNLSVLVIGNSFNQSVSELPENLIELYLGNNFNQNVDDLPRNLQRLSIGERFNHHVDNLPIFLLQLALGNYFNQTIDCLPTKLTHLILGTYFNRSIDKIPDSVRVLSLGNYFKQVINRFPANLIDLRISHNSQYNLVLPVKLTRLELIIDELKNIILPSSLKILKLSGDDFYRLHEKLPNDLHTLDLKNTRYDGFLSDLPRGLKHLILNNDFNDSVDNLSNLVSLKLGAKFNQSVGSLPGTLKRLFLDSFFNQPIDRLPCGLQELHLGRNFNQKLNKLPNIRILTIGYEFSGSINELPDSIEELDLLCKPETKLVLHDEYIKLNPDIPEEYLYEQIEEFKIITKLPKSLRILRLPIEYDRPLDHLSKSIKIEHISYEY